MSKETKEIRKILVVFTLDFESCGGITTVMMNYWRTIDKTNLHFDFACTNNPNQNLLDEINLFGCKYFKLPPRKKIWKYFFALKKLSKSYDIVHIHGNSSTSFIELKAVSNVPVRIVHNHTSKTEHPFVNAILHPFFLRSYTTAIACSSLAGDWLFGKGNFKILKNAIDIHRFIPTISKRESFRKNFGFKKDDIIVGNVGNLTKPKNHSFIIDVFYEFHKLCSNSKLLLIGSGSLEKEIKNKIEHLNLKDAVVMAGTRTDIPEMMSVMDAFLFPSLWEGLPLAVLEAQASGLPIFLSDVISSEVLASSSCFPISLEKNPKVWATFMLQNTNKDNRFVQAENNQVSLTNAGYNIHKEAQELLKLYWSK